MTRARVEMLTTNSAGGTVSVPGDVIWAQYWKESISRHTTKIALKKGASHSAQIAG